MSHLVLARKFRPQNFGSVRGQEHVCRILRNSISRKKIAHAYIFAGPRGVGKTSLARIFSKSLNCHDFKNGEPCLKCTNCLEIAQGVSLAVREIDGASHNSVENVRELIDSFRSMPPPGSACKVFIIDEVHMLSTSAFNALLKSLEEPPPNTVFILATTESHKIPETVISRCQLHNFRALDVGLIEQALESVLKAEGLRVEQGVVPMIARFSEGSLRDSQSLLERIIAYNDDSKISLASVQDILGVAGPEALKNLWSAIKREDSAAALTLLRDMFSTGVDLNKLLREFVESIRTDFHAQVIAKADNAAVAEIEQLMSMATRGADQALRSLFGEALFEALVVKLALRKIRSRPPAQIKPDTADGQPEKKTALSSAAATDPASVMPISVTPPAELKAKPASASPLDWRGFLSFTEAKNQKIMLEHLRRLEIEIFTAGNLQAAGPEFNVSAIKKTELQIKLKQLLADFSDTQAQSWKIEMKADARTKDSVYNQEIRAKQNSDNARSRNAIEHPSVQKLKQAFPGSSVVKAVVRE